jgi:hypothetical protein
MHRFKANGYKQSAIAAAVATATNTVEMEVKAIMIRLCEAALHLARWPSASAPAAPPAAFPAPCPTPASRYHATVGAGQRQAAAHLLEKHGVLLELLPHALCLSPCNRGVASVKTARDAKPHAASIHSNCSQNQTKKQINTAAVNLLPA